MDTTCFKPRYITMTAHTPADRRPPHDFDRPEPKAVPCLRLAGKWFGAAGFEPGMKVRIEVSHGRLIIEPVASP